MNTQGWTSRQLIRFSNNLAEAMGSDVQSDASRPEDDIWTTKKLVNMSHSLARAYNPGL